MMDKLDQFLAYLKHERHALPHSVISYKSDLSMMLNYFKERNIELENERDKERRERDSNSALSTEVFYFSLGKPLAIVAVIGRL